MLKFDVLNRFTGAIQFTAEIDCAETAPISIKLGLAVRWAVKAGANLADANLTRANLTRANLADANLADANLTRANLAGANLADANLTRANLADANLAGANLAGAQWAEGFTISRPPLQVSGLRWPVHILDDHMQIGCQIHRLDEWATFDDRRIAEMDGRSALNFWRVWKAPLLAMAAADGRGVSVPARERMAGGMPDAHH